LKIVNGPTGLPAVLLLHMSLLQSTSIARVAGAAALLLLSLSGDLGQAAGNRPQAAPRASSTVGSQGPLPEHAKFTDAEISNGAGLFKENCAFCHGKDASGGETGPDLTRSKVVTGDKNAEAIGQVVRNGRPGTAMPPFSLPDSDIQALAAFIHLQQDKALSQTGTRMGVEEADLRTGNAAAGKQYFEGVGGCTKCHSAMGDLARVATRFTGLQLMEQMLYPRQAQEKVTVKTATGQTLEGTVEYRDEFTVGMRDAFGVYHSWPVSAITYYLDDPAEAHVTAMSKYSDEDMHDVLAYIQTLK
jgi:cytochrome c oxidase cbb3-type subunit 3